MNRQIIGVAGTNGSGKDTIMQLLASKYHYMFVSATDLLTRELERRGESTAREHKAALSAEWRREHGMGVIVQKAYEAWQEEPARYEGLVVGSLRHPGEVEAVHQLGGIVIWIDADPKIRYARIQQNADERGRAAEDAISFEQFQAEQAREMHPTGDAATLNIAAVKENCDLFCDNSSEDIAAFQADVEQQLGLV